MKQTGRGKYIPENERFYRLGQAKKEQACPIVDPTVLKKERES